MFGRRFIIVLISFIALFVLPTNSIVSYAALNKKPAGTQIETLISNKTYREEYFKIRTPKKEKHTIYVTGKVKKNVKKICIRIKKHGTNKNYITVFVKPNAKGEFSVKINTKYGNKKVPIVLNKKGTVTKAKESVSTCPGYRKVQKMTAGTYHLYITAATSKKDAKVSNGVNWKYGTLGGTEGSIYKEAVLTVKSGQNNNLKLIKYKDVINNNQKIRNKYEKQSQHIDSYKGSYVRYQDVYLNDIPLILWNPKTKEYNYLTDDQVKYIADVAHKITNGAKTKYQKVLKIYEYVAQNVYYDHLALSERKYQYVNPYRNLYNLRNNKNSENSKNGKVATTCQGYAGLVVALARAEGIPARLAYGRHIHQPGTIWANVDKDDINTITHYWSEVYLDGKWIVADARSAMKNKWVRSDFGFSGIWDKKNFINYSHFDPTDEQLSSSYIYVGIYPGAKDGAYICRIDEVEQMTSFLENESVLGIKNGEILNSKYDILDYATWGTDADDDFMTNGYGRVSKIVWPDMQLAGNADFSMLTRLRTLDLSGNNLTDVNLSGCSKVSYVNLKDNPLHRIEIKYNGKVSSIQSTDGGSFSIVYDKQSEQGITIYTNVEEGYECIGVFNSQGECVSRGDGDSIIFEPAAGEYTIRFAITDTVNEWNDIYDEVGEEDNLEEDILENNYIKDKVTDMIFIDKVTGEVLE